MTSLFLSLSRNLVCGTAIHHPRPRARPRARTHRMVAATLERHATMLCLAAPDQMVDGQYPLTWHQSAVALRAEAEQIRAAIAAEVHTKAQQRVQTEQEEAVLLAASSPAVVAAATAKQPKV